MTKDEKVCCEVNGEPQTVGRKTTVEKILKNAGAAASIEVEELDNYFLENIHSGRKYEDLQETVAIEDGDKFVAVYAGKTPVA